MKNQSVQKMVLLDWNGTVVDDMPIWHQSISKIFAPYGIQPPSAGEYFQKLAELKGYPAVYHSMGINLSGQELDRIYSEEYQKHLNEIKLFPGVKETLEALKSRGVILGIITAQLKPLFDSLFAGLGLEKYFDEIVTDALKKDTLITHLCFLRKIELTNCYYVGDAPSDVRHAKSAGVKSVAYLTRHMPQEILLAQNPDFAITDLRELLQFVGGERDDGEKDTKSMEWNQLFW